MNKLCFLMVMFITCELCKGQNLVYNGNFEQYSTCPNGINQIDSALYWLNPCAPPYGYTTSSASGSSDYFNACSFSNVGVPANFMGYQMAHSGNGYSGFYVYTPTVLFREYIEVELTTPLISNSCYYFDMFVNISNTSNFTTDTIGIYFSNTIVSGIHSHIQLPLLPQLKIYSGFIADTLNWTSVSGSYVASGGEKYLIIGNFNDDISTNWFQFNSSGLDLSYLYVDDVSLTPCTNIQEQNLYSEIICSPNPFTSQLNVTSFKSEPVEFILYDVNGRKCIQQTFTGSISINTEQLSKGIYFYEVSNEKGVIKKGKVVKD